MAQTIIPNAAGKAAAFSTYIARGGERVSKGGSKKPGFRYTEGPMKGKTYGQALSSFESKWEKAGPGVKDKYAKRESASVTLAPMEQRELGKDYKPNASMSRRATAETNETDSDEMVGKSSGWFKAGGGEGGGVPAGGKKTVNPAATPGAGRGTPVKKATQAGVDAPQTGPSFEALTDPNQEIQSIGDGSTRENNFTPTVGADGKPVKYKFGHNFPKDMEAIGNAVHGRGFQPNPKPATVNPAATPGAGRGTPVKAPDAAAPPAQVGPPKPRGLTPQRQQNITDAGGDTSKLSSDDRMFVEGKTREGGVPVDKAPPSPTTRSDDPENSGKPRMQGSSAERGELIGIRKGVPQYASPDELYGAAKPSIRNTINSTPADADPTKPVMIKPQSIEERRGDYQNRENLEIATRNAPRAIPVIQPTPRAPRKGSLDDPNNAFSKDAYARTAAAQQKGHNDASIRAGTASESTRATNPDLVSRMAQGVKDYGSGPTGAGGNLQKGDTTRYSDGRMGTILSRRPAPSRFAMPRR